MNNLSLGLGAMRRALDMREELGAGVVASGSSVVVIEVMQLFDRF